MPQYGGADPTRKDPVVVYGRERLSATGTAFRPLHVLTECPQSFVTDDSRAMLELYALHAAFEGALPEPGGLLDQPAVLMEALSIIKHESTSVKEFFVAQAEEKAKRDQKRKGGHDG